MAKVNYRNLTAQRSLIPAVDHQLHCGRDLNQGCVVSLITGVSAIDRAANLTSQQIWTMWQNRPSSHDIVDDIVREHSVLSSSI